MLGHTDWNTFTPEEKKLTENTVLLVGFYEHFIKEVVCTYSVVVNIDITNLKGQKLYPAMIWLLTKTVNDMPEFRTSLTPEGLGIYDDMHPMYTVFNRRTRTFPESGLTFQRTTRLS